jgi:hypothetical protein
VRGAHHRRRSVWGGDPEVVICVDDHSSHAEQASMLRRSIAWGNRNVRDRRLGEVVNRADVA